MLKLRSIPIPASHHVKIDSAALPVAALASSLPFEGLVRRTSEALHQELHNSARNQAHTEAVRRRGAGRARSGRGEVGRGGSLASDAVLSRRDRRQLLRVEIAEQNYGLEEMCADARRLRHQAWPLRGAPPP